MRVIDRLRALLRDASGQDLIEYAMLAALIAVGSIAVIMAAGGSVQQLWTVVEGLIAGVAATV
jgi:Flp pilus assembly pilin Flp